MSTPPAAVTVGPLLEDFFCRRLIQERGASPHTVSAYRDTFALLLGFTEARTQKAPSRVLLQDLDVALVSAFLDHLERKRGNGARTRNARLAAIRSFLNFASRQAPQAMGSIGRVLAIPPKRFDRPEVGFLTRPEIEALLAAPDAATWTGRRDRVLLRLLYNTGARVSEAVGIVRGDVALGPTASVRLRGKGRKERTVPLWRSTARSLREWVRRLPGEATAPVFPASDGGRMTRANVADRVRRATTRAAAKCPSIRKRRVSPHTLRHTTAMHLLQSGVDITTIALWLGHESPTTTHLYLQADVSMRERALARLREPGSTATRFHPSDRLLGFLKAL